MKDIFKEYSNVAKSFNVALLFIYVYAMKDMKVIVKDLRDVKYVMSHFMSSLASRVYSRYVTIVTYSTFVVVYNYTNFIFKEMNISFSNFLSKLNCLNLEK